MDRVREVLGNNSIEDVHWLCSLSESELDMLISLKMIVIQRSKVIGYKELATRFDLKTLRVLALVLMEHTKENIKNLCHVPDLVKSAAFMDGCGLLQCKVGDVLGIEELQRSIGIDERKKRSKRPREEVAVK